LGSLCGHANEISSQNRQSGQTEAVDPEIDGYLREFDDDLEGALNLVIRDLQTGDLSAGEASGLVWQLAEWRFDWVDSEPAGMTALEVAEDAQERVIENCPAHNWPACPRHPKHPLWLAGQYPERSWTCTATGERIANLGRLGRAAQ